MYPEVACNCVTPINILDLEMLFNLELKHVNLKDGVVTSMNTFITGVEADPSIIEGKWI